MGCVGGKVSTCWPSDAEVTERVFAHIGRHDRARSRYRSSVRGGQDAPGVRAPSASADQAPPTSLHQRRPVASGRAV
jgi:hypothetical protein